MEEIEIEEPVIEEVKATNASTLPEASAAPSLDLAATCGECGQRFSGCHDRHVKVNLSKLLIINSVKYGPGEAVVPEEADGLWRSAL